MKFRFSLRVLLIATVIVAGAAAFVALRMQPAKIAAQFQRAVLRKDQAAAEAMIAGAGIEETLRRHSHLKDPRSWELVSCDVSEQSAEQWLHGVTVGQFVVEFYFISENADGGSSAYQVCYYDVAISTRGVEIIKFRHDEPAVAVWDNSMFPAEDAAPAADD